MVVDGTEVVVDLFGVEELVVLLVGVVVVADVLVVVE